MTIVWLLYLKYMRTAVSVIKLVTSPVKIYFPKRDISYFLSYLKKPDKHLSLSMIRLKYNFLPFQTLTIINGGLVVWIRNPKGNRSNSEWKMHLYIIVFRFTFQTNLQWWRKIEKHFYSCSLDFVAKLGYFNLKYDTKTPDIRNIFFYTFYKIFSRLAFEHAIARKG